MGWTWRPLMLLCGFLFVGSKFMQWIWIPFSTFGETCKIEGYLRSIDSFFFLWLQIKIAYWLFKILVFLTYCVSQIEVTFGIKCRCQLTFILVFKNVTWHFRFEVERQMKFVKHRHWVQCPSRSRISAQDKVIWGNDWYGRQEWTKKWVLKKYKNQNQVGEKAKILGRSVDPNRWITYL